MKINPIVLFTFAVGLVILVSCMTGCEVSNYDCSQYAYNKHMEWYKNDFERAKVECLKSEVFGPFSIEGATKKVKQLELLGQCQEPGPYLRREYTEYRKYHYLVFCPKDYVRS